jgi:protein ImuB
MKRILCLKVENPQRATGSLQAVAARCKQFTPLVGIDADVFPQSVLLDITNVIHLFGGEAALVERIVADLSRCGGSPGAAGFRVAVAHTPSAAWALAGYGEKDSSIHPASCILHPSFSPLPLEALRLPEPIVALLHSLGIWRIGQLDALPRRELSSRFGPELLDGLDRVTGRLSEPLPAWDPPAEFEVSWSVAEINDGWPTARRETIWAALEQLVRRLAAKLTQAGRGAMRLECLLKSAAGPGAPERQLSVGLFRPVAWANHLIGLLEVQFESLQLPGPVESIRLTAVSTAPLELRQQEMFYEGPRRVDPHHLSGLIDRLSNRLGHTRVMRVRLIPDAQPELACHYQPLVLSREAKGFPNRKTVGRRRNSVGDRPQQRKADPTPVARPLRLLTQPVRLLGGIDGPFSAVPGAPGERIVRRVGPERIETGWWRGRAVARDYYRAETTTGRCYWIYRQLPSGPWFLHGIFD